jgi:hypothetical protein
MMGCLTALCLHLLLAQIMSVNAVQEMQSTIFTDTQQAMLKFHHTWQILGPFQTGTRGEGSPPSNGFC